MSVYTEDRDTFERQMLQPPHAARLMDHAKRFVGLLGNTDREILLRDASEEFWETREQIKETQDILRLWIKALEYAARRRPKWHIKGNGHDWWVKGSQLGKQS